MKCEETWRVDPGEMVMCSPWKDSPPESGVITSATAPLALPEFVTMIDAIRTSPTYPGSPDTAKPDPPDVVKFVELVDSSECIGEKSRGFRRFGECGCNPMQDSNNIATNKGAVLLAKALMISALMGIV